MHWFDLIWFVLVWGERLMGGGRKGKRASRTPLLETQIVSDEWSNMRIWNGSVTSNVASSKSGGGAPSGLNGPIGTADVRMRAGMTYVVVTVA